MASRREVSSAPMNIRELGNSSVVNLASEVFRNEPAGEAIGDLKQIVKGLRRLVEDEVACSQAPQGSWDGRAYVAIQTVEKEKSASQVQGGPMEILKSRLPPGAAHPTAPQQVG